MSNYAQHTAPHHQIPPLVFTMFDSANDEENDTDGDSLPPHIYTGHDPLVIKTVPVNWVEFVTIDNPPIAQSASSHGVQDIGDAYDTSSRSNSPDSINIITPPLSTPSASKRSVHFAAVNDASSAFTVAIQRGHVIDYASNDATNSLGFYGRYGKSSRNETYPIVPTIVVSERREAPVQTSTYITPRKVSNPPAPISPKCNATPALVYPVHVQTTFPTDFSTSPAPIIYSTYAALAEDVYGPQPELSLSTTRKRASRGNWFKRVVKKILPRWR